MKNKSLGLGKFTGMINTATRVETTAPDRHADISLLDAKPQIRRRFGEQSLAELAESITSIGILQPIIVKPKPDGRFEIIAGERRFRAAKIAGLTKVPILTRNVSTPEERREIMIAENQQRENVDPYDEALGVAEDVGIFGLEETARIWKRSKSWVSKRVSVSDYLPDVTALLSTGICTDLEVLHCLNTILPEDGAGFEQFVRRINEGAPITRIREDSRTRVQELKEKRKASQQQKDRADVLTGTAQPSVGADAPHPRTREVPVQSDGHVRAEQVDNTSTSDKKKPDTVKADAKAPATEAERQLSDLGRIAAASLTKVQHTDGDLYRSFALIAAPLVQLLGKDQTRDFLDRLVADPAYGKV